MRERKPFLGHAFTWSNKMARIRCDLPPIETQETPKFPNLIKLIYNKKLFNPDKHPYQGDTRSSKFDCQVNFRPTCYHPVSGRCTGKVSSAKWGRLHWFHTGIRLCGELSEQVIGQADL